MNAWPLQRDCDKFYGNPRNPADPALPSRAWEAANLTVIETPFTLYYAGKPTTHVRIHKLVAPSLAKVFKTIWTVAGQHQKLVDEWGASVYGGSYCYRQMRGLNTLSMHSYGCAIDLDPARNALHNRKPHFTPGCPVVQAFLSEGWTWGGDWDGDHSSADEPRADGMHFQAARLK